MIINDSVYGKLEITDPLLVSLVKSKPLQRIKKVNQAGTQLVFTKINYSRYDHCVGVMWLLRKQGASLEEQIAGLLHDVSHTAFSHAMDFAFDEGETQAYHERFVEKVVFDSEIPTILKKYNVNAKNVVDESKFKLLEREIPALCADRIDYFLRDMTDEYGKTPEIKSYLKHITVVGSEFVLDDKKVAKQYAERFMWRCENFWNAPKTLATFALLGKAVRRALQIGDLVEADLFTTDDFVYKKLKKSKDLKIKETLKLLTPKLSVKISKGEYDFFERGKARYVDPKVLIKGKKVKLTSLYPIFEKEIKEFKKRVKTGYKIKIIQKKRA